MKPAKANRIADFIRAVGILQPQDAETYEAICELLGVDALREQAPSSEASPSTLAKSPPRPDPPSPSSKPASEPKADTNRPKRVVRSDITPLSGSGLEIPTWVTSTPPLQLPQESRPRNEVMVPLLKPEWIPSILLWSVGLPTADVELDLKALVEIIAQGKVATRLPSSLRPTLSRGIHVLIDESEGMEPFIQDQRSMLDMVQRVVGLERTSWSFFSGSPRSQESAEAVPAGRPVLALTDLSIARLQRPLFHTDPNDWLDFQAQLNHLGCLLTVFVPYPARRWPRSFRNLVHLVQWDQLGGPSSGKRTTLNQSLI